MVVEGWLQKRSPWSFHGEKRRYFVLDEQKRELAYYKVMHGLGSESILATVRVGTIHLQDATEIADSQVEHGAFDVLIPGHLHELRAPSAEMARRWVAALRPLLGSPGGIRRRSGSPSGSSSPSSGARQRCHSPPGWATPAVPWCVEAVWLEGKSDAKASKELTDAPLILSAELGTVDPGAYNSKVLLADGTILVLDSEYSLMDGVFKEVAASGSYSLQARMARTDGSGCTVGGSSSSTKRTGTVGRLQSLGNVADCDANVAAAFVGGAALALGVVAAMPAGVLVQAAPVLSVLLLAASVALQAGGSFCASLRSSVEKVTKTTKPPSAQPAEQAGGWRLELKSVVKEQRRTASSLTSAAGPSRPGGSPPRRPRPLRRQPLSGDSVGSGGSGGSGLEAEDTMAAPLGVPSGAPDFSGSWQLSLKRSDDPSEFLKALGVPWAARAALRHATRQAIIEHDGLEWIETTITPVLRRTVKMLLDGSEHLEVSPVDKSTVVMTSRFDEDGRCIVTRSAYSDGKSQVTRRYLEDGGKTYHVINMLSVSGDKDIVVNNYFELTTG